MMNIFVFFSSTETLINYNKYVNTEQAEEVKFSFISIKPIENDELMLLKEKNIKIIENESLFEAMSCAAKLVDNNVDTIITTADVVPVDDFVAKILESKVLFPDMASGFGRWYQGVLGGRHQVQKLGYKYKDTTPRLIANHIIDHTPNFESHAKQVSRFHVFFNWFSKEISIELASALDKAVSFSEMSLFLSQFLESMRPDKKMYYLPSFEVIDIKLL
ncbi:hypothetical protein [Alteromonas stellipolaris]|uniref:hypothetical protein n=1 Tax=Alteromonas stellipolaris TaxID=233316 RepID=UPI001D6200FF|nr:hypothetical protein [Alteromonas stellipolaris]MBZ2163622.1 hypothetical protein [Alteromonas stellipolaris]